ncbi:LPS export ABC transporter periplasmic protein LptC [Hellea balneolensis]|uniref:LPS export ABC transporter periplasmic protein LptC n=1 Tax=Hellea balneolensis TaxID=287478 RepID=UPI0004128181|nr:LPS export ABC transporter periplasmic protein LptC [Hellea balneolensis]
MNSAVISSGDRSASDALGLWEPKRTLTLEAARKHSARIKFMRRALLGICALLAAALIYQFATQSSTIILEDNPTESVKMVNPRYSGRTTDGLPFYLTADTATRTLANRSEVALIKPVLEFIREDGAEASMVVAETGTYDDVKKILNLRTAVDLNTDDGYNCQTTHARIFAKEKRIEGDERIECNGSFGIVNGNSYEINDNYRVFVFKDGMDAIIEQGQELGLEGNE